MNWRAQVAHALRRLADHIDPAPSSGPSLSGTRLDTLMQKYRDRAHRAPTDLAAQVWLTLSAHRLSVRAACARYGVPYTHVTEGLRRGAPYYPTRTQTIAMRDLLDALGNATRLDAA
jgi:hypothetical protein